MAQFCTKCGAPLGEGMKFCISCGSGSNEPAGLAAPIAAAAVPPAAAIPAPAIPPPAPAPVVAPGAKSGSPVLKIVLIVLAVIFLFGLLSAGACVYFVYRAKQRVTQFEKQVQTSFPAPIQTGQPPVQPGGPMESPGSAQPPTTAAVDLGALSYPGAVALEGGGQLNLGVAGFKAQAFTTSDSVDTVAAYYKTKLGPAASIVQNGGTTVVQVTGANGFISVTITPDQSTGKTKIAVSSIGRQ